MKKLPRLISQRKKNAQILTDLLKNDNVTLPQQRKNETINWYLYTIAVKNRDKIMKKLNSSGIGARIYYSPPIHKTPYYKTKLHLPNTEWAALSCPKLTNTSKSKKTRFGKNEKNSLRQHKLI